MPEYVYALHDFHPENEDEIAFLAGQPIEVIEKDDQYSDGWWQGRNLAGKIGLFPNSYTTPAAPSPSDTVLLSESIANTPGLPRLLNEEVDPSSDSESKIGVALGEPLAHQEEVMEATMTDVQKAIEQLGQNDRDGARSFSFASTRYGDTDHETDTETDGGTSLQEGEGDGEDLHRSARDKLAEQARKVVEAKAATATRTVPQRSLAPPIEIEMSDESEAEYEDDRFDHLHDMHPFSRDHPHIPEEDEEDGENNPENRYHKRKGSSARSSAILPLEDRLFHTPGDGEQTATLNQTTFPVPSKSAPASASLAGHDRSVSESRSAPVSPMANIFASIPVGPIDPCSVQLPVSPEPTVQVTPVPEIRDAVSSTPHAVSQSLTSRHNSIASSGQGSTTSMLQISSESMRISSPQMKSGPSEWTVEEVIEWLKSKGFGQDICDKFIEQEITGDVLLELDINLLKAEIGIAAFGKRMRIANAISELRRPPSIIFPDNQSSQPFQSHSRAQSYSYAHSHSGSTHQSLNSPVFTSTMGSVATAPSSATFGSMIGPESPAADGRQIVTKRLSSLSGTGISVNGNSVENTVSAGVASATGLGFLPVNGKEHKRMGSGQLAPSPSDGALNKCSQSTTESAEVQDDDRSALSEGENGLSVTKYRRHLGRSTGSSTTVKDETPSNNNSSAALSTSSALPMASPRSPRKELLDNSSVASRQSSKSRNKRGVDSATKGTERHSIFGGTFSTSLGKGRKPPPRLTQQAIDENSMEKSSALSLSRLYGGRKTSVRPSTSDGSVASSLRNFSRGDPLDEKKKLKENTSAYRETAREKELLVATNARADGPTTFQPGQSIIDQIGTPDHQGWMRKKGDHYNAWKARYFIIKGPHLYILRGDNKEETKIKGYINIVGYKVIADENIDPGRYGFRIVHETDKTHFFSSDEQSIVREWMKAIMKATIGRDYSKPVVSSVNIPTIPLTVAQAMNPAPRPPSPSARDATQKALRRDNPNQLSSRDARVLMGLPSSDAGDTQDSEQSRLASFFTHQTIQGDAPSATSVANDTPPRPTREGRPNTSTLKASDAGLIEWANSHLATPLRIHDPTGQLYTGLALLRLAESVVGKPTSPSVPDSAFPSGPNDDKLDGLFRLFDFLLDNDVKMGSVSINDVRQGKRDKIVQLLKALKSWEDKRKDILRSVGVGSVQGGPFIAPALTSWKM